MIYLSHYPHFPEEYKEIKKVNLGQTFRILAVVTALSKGKKHKTQVVMEFYVRAYQEEDLPQIAQLFYNTVHEVNSKEYTPKQLDAWAPKDKAVELWKSAFDGHFVFVAELNGVLKGMIVGYGIMRVDGLLEHLYTHKDFLNKGIGSAILNKMVDLAQKIDLREIQVEASLTSKPFFVKKGFKNITLQKKRHRNLLYLNYFMHLVLK